MSRFADPLESPGFLLWHATLRWERAVVAALKPIGLTHAQFVLLACADWLDSGEGVRQVDVGAQAGTDPVMTSEVLRRLEARGLVSRDRDPDDGRARRIRVSAEGSRLAARAIAAVEEVDAAYFAGAASALVPALRRMADSTDGSPDRSADDEGPGSR